jgi:hypothetical protein
MFKAIELEQKGKKARFLATTLDNVDEVEDILKTKNIFNRVDKVDLTYGDVRDWSHACSLYFTDINTKVPHVILATGGTVLVCHDGVVDITPIYIDDCPDGGIDNS